MHDESMLGWALRYAARGWRVFPLHTILPPGRCSCGKTCDSPGKHPRTRNGFRDATTEPATIKKWWTRWPDANIGISTGSGLAVIDVDGPEGWNELKRLLEDHQPLPETLVAQTGNGFHFVFSTRDGGPEIRNTARGNVHTRGEGGYIVAPPSRHHSGKIYKWVRANVLAPLPDWVRQWTQGYEITATRAPLPALGPLPSYLAQRTNVPDPARALDRNLRSAWSPAEQARLESALNSIPSSDYQTWFTVGMALQSLGWESNEADIGFQIWDRWSQRTPEKYAPAVCEAKWSTFGRTDRQGVGIGTIYHLAQQHGWNPAIEALAPPQINGTNGHHYTLPPQMTVRPIIWPDVNEDGKPRVTMLNTKVAIKHLGCDCRHDVFHNRLVVDGEMVAQWGEPELSDPMVVMLRDAIRTTYGYDPKKENVYDACETLCYGRRFDPVADYLDSLRWDNVPRLDHWLTIYLSADPTEFIRAAGALTLIAAVRRVRHPGAKFDQILVLEGAEGKGKSTAIEILAGSENFSDQRILDKDDRTQQELTEGVWLYEIGEMGGMRKAEIEHVKAFASRKYDRARPAYGRKLIRQPRRCVFIGTTNRDDYLVSDTGNRRFWPVRTGRVDLNGLLRDRDQLWAEAAAREAAGASVVLPEHLWTVASHHQSERQQLDPWLEPIHNYLTFKDIPETSIHEVLVANPNLQLQAGQIGQREQNRAATVLRHLGFVRFQKRENGRQVWKYRKGQKETPA